MPDAERRAGGRGPPPLQPPHLQSRPIHVLGQLHSDPVCDNKGIIRIDLQGEGSPGSPRERVRL